MVLSEWRSKRVIQNLMLSVTELMLYDWLIRQPDSSNNTSFIHTARFLFFVMIWQKIRYFSRCSNSSSNGFSIPIFKNIPAGSRALWLYILTSSIRDYMNVFISNCSILSLIFIYCHNYFPTLPPPYQNILVVLVISLHRSITDFITISYSKMLFIHLH